MRGSVLALAAALLGVAVEPARAEPTLPTHIGESGYLDVPSADTLAKAGASFTLDLRYLESRDQGRSIGPSPLVMSFGLGRAEAGLSLRQGGLPGDPRPATTIPAGAGKFSLLEAKGKRPALAVDLFVDHITRTPDFHLRGIATTERHWRTRLTAFAGGVIGIDRPSGWTAGAALSVLGPRKTELVAEILRQPMGRLSGGGVRWQPIPQFAVGAGVSYLPDDARTLLAGVTVVFLSPAPVRPAVQIEAEQAQAETKPKAGKHVFSSERPRFPLEIRQRPLPGAEGGPARHYPGNAVAVSAEPSPGPATPEPAEGKAEPAPETPVKVVKQVLPPPQEGDLTLPLLRGDRIVQRRVIDSLLLSVRDARAPMSVSDREAVKRLATRAAAGEGDLIIWAAAVGSSSSQVLSAVGRAVTVKQLAARLGRLRPAQIGIQVGQGEAGASSRILVALLVPEETAAPAPAKPEPHKAKPAAEPGPAPAPAVPPVTPPPVPPAAAPAAAGGLAKPPRSAPPDAGADGKAPAPTPDAGPDLLRDTQPARVERPVPLPPTLKEGAAAQDQVGKAIASFQPALKECVDRALKRDPSLRGEALIKLDIKASGQAIVAGIKSKTLAGGWFEDCVRQAALQWRMPRTPEGYQVEIPVKLRIVNGDSR